MERSSGILMHISSLPNKYGIGSFGESAYDFVDFLIETGQSYWQILPLTTTSFGDSPYSSYSAFAGNTNFIDFDLLIEQKYLKPADVKDINFGENPKKVDYTLLGTERRLILEKAVENFITRKGLNKTEYKQFVKMNESWLVPFCEFMTIKESFNGNPWYEWPEKYRMYDSKTVHSFYRTHKKSMDYHHVTQFLFFKQWYQLKKYANDSHILIIGDIPIYVARDSVEMWKTPELFLVDENKTPTVVSGTPPDGFSDEGQHWGNPIYDWRYMKIMDYSWWIWRIEESFKLYDYVRLDHFRGFEAYWEIPFEAASAKEGHWVKGPGKDLFTKFAEKLGKLNVIAEDLGYITEGVDELLEYTGYPGMKILQHAFNGKEESEHMPHQYIRNTIAYVGTHDNETGYGWYVDSAEQIERDQMDLYLNRRPGEHVSDALNRGIAASVSNVVIYTMQDLQRLGNEARMNLPATIGNNWDWRMEPKSITIDLTEKLLQWTQTYFRENHQTKSKKDKNGSKGEENA